MFNRLFTDYEHRKARDTSMCSLWVTLIDFTENKRGQKIFKNGISIALL